MGKKRPIKILIQSATSLWWRSKWSEDYPCKSKQASKPEQPAQPEQRLHETICSILAVTVRNYTSLQTWATATICHNWEAPSSKTWGQRQLQYKRIRTSEKSKEKGVGGLQLTNASWYAIERLRFTFVIAKLQDSKTLWQKSTSLSQSST